MSEKNHRAFRRLRMKKGDDLKALYAKARRAFTAADLQRYTEAEECLPAEHLLAELEALAEMPKRKKS